MLSGNPTPTQKSYAFDRKTIVRKITAYDENQLIDRQVKWIVTVKQILIS